MSLGGSTAFIVVTGHSMEPTLSPGDFVVLRTGDYAVGDVVSYMPFDEVPAQVIHRILEFNDDGTITLQGDNNSFIDPFAPTVDDISGRMVFSIPNVGAVTWFLGQPLVWGSFLLIAAALILYPRNTTVTAEEELDDEAEKDL